jgi:hypothetical protein
MRPGAETRCQLRSHYDEGKACNRLKTKLEHSGGLKTKIVLE